MRAGVDHPRDDDGFNSRWLAHGNFILCDDLYVDLVQSLQRARKEGANENSNAYRNVIDQNGL